MSPLEPLLTPQETAIVSGVPIRSVYKAARERLPARMVVRSRGRILFKPTAAVCFRLDHQLPKDIPVKVRKALYSKVERDPSAATVEHREGPLSYLVHVSAAEEAVNAELTALRRAMALIAEENEVQAGAATFKGTRILVHTVAHLLRAGATPGELKQDYPNLTDAMIAAAPVFARAHPRRGRPKSPGWRNEEAKAARRYRRTAA